jgi:cyclophilin family peptidyl-prolyl cis-trans isomerase
MRRPLLAVLSLFSAASLWAQSTAPTVARAVPSQTLAPGGTAVTLNLADYFLLNGVQGSIVRFDTVLGKFDVELRPDAAPQQVTNFLGYVQRGDYNSTFIHRSSSLGLAGPNLIIQGGGYTLASSGPEHIPQQAPVPLEYNLPNARGTIAAARTSSPNSATSEWFINVGDNSSTLGPSNAGGYTVFGRVLGNGMSVVDAIAALPRVNASGGDPSNPFSELPVHDYTSGNIGASNLVMVNSVTPISMFPSASAPGAIAFSATSSATNVVTVSLSGSTLTLTPVAAGNASITVQATDIAGGNVTFSVPVTVSTAVPAISAQPHSVTVAAGSTAVLTATASAANTYQWQFNGQDIPGANSPTLVVTNATAANAGNYTLIARNTSGSATSESASLTIANVAATDVGRLVNLSIRSNAGVGDQTLSVGFALGGDGVSGSTPLLLRGMGPSLSQFGLSGLPDPVATLYVGTTAIANNDNWGGDATIVARRQAVNAFPFVSTSSLDAALATSPAAGVYSMQVTGNGSTTGTALAEIYDATGSSYTATTPRLINVSARAQVGTGNDVLIAGFVVGGNTGRTVLVRAVGPSLAAFGVGGTLADPQLSVAPLNGATIATNDNWSGEPQVAAASASVGAFPLSSGASTDAALLVTLPPGAYSAQVSGANGGTGVAIVEVYEVP